MGSGKSHWGHIWALEEGYTFYDLDAEIEKVFELPVEEIFEKYGEDKFREMERSHLRKFENQEKKLVSCGGGTPCFFDNPNWEHPATRLAAPAIVDVLINSLLDTINLELFNSVFCKLFSEPV